MCKLTTQNTANILNSNPRINFTQGFTPIIQWPGMPWELSPHRLTPAVQRYIPWSSPCRSTYASRHPGILNFPIHAGYTPPIQWDVPQSSTHRLYSSYTMRNPTSTHRRYPIYETSHKLSSTYRLYYAIRRSTILHTQAENYEILQLNTCTCTSCNFCNNSYQLLSIHCSDPAWITCLRLRPLHLSHMYIVRRLSAIVMLSRVNNVNGFS